MECRQNDQTQCHHQQVPSLSSLPSCTSSSCCSNPPKPKPTAPPAKSPPPASPSAPAPAAANTSTAKMASRCNPKRATAAWSSI
mmetsp:Transcript_980/g.2064  ORF Transcript_980/g.2064 Transcript_980/m.2064 type:complete len:84 (-) Transcript_980:1823-2074(-)